MEILLSRVVMFIIAIKYLFIYCFHQRSKDPKDILSCHEGIIFITAEQTATKENPDVLSCRYVHKQICEVVIPFFKILPLRILQYYSVFRID